jgi:hypothetical protein
VNVLNFDKFKSLAKGCPNHTLYDFFLTKSSGGQK